MLTQQDLKAIGQLIDNKLANDIAAIQTRLADLERSKPDSLAYVRLFNLVSKVETRMAALEHKVSKAATKDEMNKRFESMDKKIDNLSDRLQKNAEELVELITAGFHSYKKRMERLEEKVFKTN
jgi:tetrahydromethanopterin S-methyltransferase subunit G